MTGLNRDVILKGGSGADREAVIRKLAAWKAAIESRRVRESRKCFVEVGVVIHNSPAGQKVWNSLDQELVFEALNKVLNGIQTEKSKENVEEIQPEKRTPDFRIKLTSAERPPRGAEFLLMLLPYKSNEPLIGDLEEKYRTVWIPKYGVRRAKFHYWWQAIINIGLLGVAVLKRLALGTVLLKAASYLFKVIAG